MTRINGSVKDTSLQTLIERRTERILTPLESFVRKQAAAGLLLIFSTLLVLFLANSPWSGWIHAIARMNLGVYAHHWVFWLANSLLDQ